VKIAFVREAAPNTTAEHDTRLPTRCARAAAAPRRAASLPLPARSDHRHVGVGHGVGGDPSLVLIELQVANPRGGSARVLAGVGLRRYRRGGGMGP